MSAHRSLNLVACATRSHRPTFTSASSARLSNPRIIPAAGNLSRFMLSVSSRGVAQKRSYGSCCGGGGCGGAQAGEEEEEEEEEENRRRKKKIAYIALGSNLGDRFAEIERACKEMDKRGIRVLRTSSLWETAPMYVLDQDRFVNGACEVETTLEPMELLDALQDIENTMGRYKVIDKGPRNIDLDILMYEDCKIYDERLTIPHIGIREREFVLRPLAELIPYKPLYADQPWTLIQDLLNKLPHNPDLSPLTPLGGTLPPISSWNKHRRTHLMAILNTTPDSFSDGGITARTPIETLASQMITSGATIIDIGGHSTAPGSAPVESTTELARVLPAITAVRGVPGGKDVAISVDTFRADVAEKAVAAGADIINDVSAGLMDERMLPTVARLGCSVALMHMRGTVATMGESRYLEYPQGVISGIAKELLARVTAAEAVGIRRWRIMLDPGLGFSKTALQNVEVIARLEDLREWPGLRGLPWMLGPSRKRFVGKVTGVEKAEERRFGTAGAVVGCVAGGADVVRVHDVKEMGEVMKMADWIWRLVDEEGNELD